MNKEKLTNAFYCMIEYRPLKFTEYGKAEINKLRNTNEKEIWLIKAIKTHSLDIQSNCWHSLENIPLNYFIL